MFVDVVRERHYQSRMRALLFVLVIAACGSPQQPAPAVTNHVATTPVTAPAPATHRILEFTVVDENSAFMQKLYAHAQHDPGAARDGVTANVDAWADETGGRHTDFYLRGERAAIERYLADLAAKDPAFAVPADRQLGYEKQGDAYRTYFLEAAAALDERAIREAHSDFDPNTGAAIVLLDMTSEGKDAFAKLTQRIVGKKLAILYRGNIKSAPIINGAITGGRASISMGGTDPAVQKQEAEELAHALAKGVSAN